MAGTLAIDLGSTTTVVAYQGAAEQSPQLVALPPISTPDPAVFPSLIWLAKGDSAVPLIGRQVIEAGLLERSTAGLHRDFKRWIGADTAAGSGGKSIAFRMDFGASRIAVGEPAAVTRPWTRRSPVLAR
jgi:hypothetical protein